MTLHHSASRSVTRINYGIALAFSSLLCYNPAIKTYAQTADTAGIFKSHGTLWGLTFADYVYKGSADTVGEGLGRGNNQYSKMPASSRFFQFRRIYLGYNYDISPRLSAEFLLASEDDLNQGSIGNQSTPGDVLNDGKLAPFIKLANIRWKNVFKGSDLVFGQMSTPSFPLLSETVWGYRSIERTVADMRRTNSYDAGAALQGRYGKDQNFGYNLMVGNNNGAKPPANNFQMFYGDIWAKLLDKRLILDLYQDYAKLDWSNVDTLTGHFHHDRRMTKLLIAWSVPKFTAGVEAFTTTLMGDIEASTLTARTYYLSTKATAVSLYVRGRLYKDKWGFFARYDNYNPGNNIGEITGNPKIISYAPFNANYDPTTKEQLFLFGFDYTPFPNLHLMPNIYVNTYQCNLPANDYGLSGTDKGSGVKGTDAAYRLTVYYLFGKKDPVNY